MAFDSIKSTPDSLTSWLSYAENLTDKAIELGLTRMRTMIARMGISFSCPVFTVAGTNGKGSTCALISSVLLAAGYRVGMHTSPHLLRFNERAVICGQEVEDSVLCRAFDQVNRARDGMPLTYFEFTGLAILKIFSDAKLDAVVLEIGLGGRLDAMNAIDTDCGIVCAIGIDHTAYLGTTREAIAYEKACIYRPWKPALVTDLNPPATLIDYARKIGAPLIRYGKDFTTRVKEKTFDFSFGATAYEDLPKPALAGTNQIQNAAGAIAAVTLLSDRLPVTREAIEKGLKTVYMPGRFERFTVPGFPNIPVFVDVGHNPQAACVLFKNITATQSNSEMLYAVFAMLRDKDMRSVARTMAPAVSHWFISGLTGLRGARLDELKKAMHQAEIADESISDFDSVDSALRAALDAANRNLRHPVRILVFGSFVTVGQAVQTLQALGACACQSDSHAR